MSPSSTGGAGAPDTGCDARRRALDAGLARLALDVDRHARERLLEYVRLLTRWSRAYNLTAVRDPGQMVPRHLLDCLAVLPHLHGEQLLDVGSGAGLPGLVLAIAEPRRSWVLLDSNAKKHRFLVQALRELDVANAEVVRARVEEFRPATRFSTIISRAFASIADFVAAGERLVEPGGRLLAMKGRFPEQELAALGPLDARVQVVPLGIPGLEREERHLVVVKPRL